MPQQIGLIGLAVMGQNLVLNIESRGFSVAVFNRTGERTREFVEGKAAGKNIKGCYSMEEFVGSLERPRKIMVMVKAGKAVDDMLEQVVPHLERGDIVIDGGNSYFADTVRRGDALAEKGIRYIGTGVSGGEEGALHGPSIMPGGPREAYDQVAPVFQAIAAKTDDGPCVTYIGPGAAGHFVKMVHNGIEYGDMQLIAEAYDMLRSAIKIDAVELGDIFGRWNRGVLSSFLIEITARIFAKVDPETNKPLVELILDKAGQKGTGKWTSQVALDLGVPTPTLNTAVESRILSGYKDERVKASKVLKGPRLRYRGGRQELIDGVHDGLYASKICSYAQGMAMLRAASQEYNWNLNLGEISRIWKGGCIIRAAFLDKIKQAYQRDANLPNLLLDREFAEAIMSRQSRWRMVVQTAARMGVAVPAFAASLGYFDSYRRDRLPANLIQAQRDLFGAHTYERVDKPGVFHTEW
jgi:6-phosphogluconate dehydrogenase